MISHLIYNGDLVFGGDLLAAGLFFGSLGFQFREVEGLALVVDVLVGGDLFSFFRYALKCHGGFTCKAGGVQFKGYVHGSGIGFRGEGGFSRDLFPIFQKGLFGFLVHQGSLYRVFLARGQVGVKNRVHDHRFFRCLSTAAVGFDIPGGGPDFWEINGLFLAVNVRVDGIDLVVFLQGFKCDQGLSFQVRSVKGKYYFCFSVLFLWCPFSFCGNLRPGSVFRSHARFLVHQFSAEYILLARFQILISDGIHDGNLFSCYDRIGSGGLVQRFCFDARKMDGLAFIIDVLMLCDLFFLTI